MKSISYTENIEVIRNFNHGKQSYLGGLYDKKGKNMKKKFEN